MPLYKGQVLLLPSFQSVFEGFHCKFCAAVWSVFHNSVTITHAFVNTHMSTQFILSHMYLKVHILSFLQLSRQLGGKFNCITYGHSYVFNVKFRIACLSSTQLRNFSPFSQKIITKKQHQIYHTISYSYMYVYIQFTCSQIS